MSTEDVFHVGVLAFIVWTWQHSYKLGVRAERRKWEDN